MAVKAHVWGATRTNCMTSPYRKSAATPCNCPRCGGPRRVHYIGNSARSRRRNKGK